MKRYIASDGIVEMSGVRDALDIYGGRIVVFDPLTGETKRLADTPEVRRGHRVEILNGDQTDSVVWLP